MKKQFHQMLEKQFSFFVCNLEPNIYTNQLTKILNRCGADKLSNEILAGVILEAVRACQQNDSQVSTWESEGLKILKPGRGRKKFI